MKNARKSFLQQYHEALQNREAYKLALEKAKGKEKELTDEFCDKFTRNSIFEEIHEDLKKQWDFMKKLNRGIKFWECVVNVSVYFATREEAVKVLGELLNNPKMAKAKAHHKKVESFMLEKYPHLTMYESDGVLYIRLKGQNYEEQRHGEIYISLDEAATAFMHHDNIKKYVEKTEFPQANAKELTRRFLDTEKQWNGVIKKTRKQTQEIKSRLGYPTHIWSGRDSEHRQVETFYF